MFVKLPQFSKTLLLMMMLSGIVTLAKPLQL